MTPPKRADPRGHSMSKPLIFVILLCAAAVAAGLFGALHNQLSYSVGPDYFHGFKFAQFGINPERHNRLGAALVGWRASWWMGPLVGLPAFALGLAMLGNPRRYLAAGIGAIAAVLVITLFCAMAGLAVGLTLGGAGFVADMPVPEGVADRTGFVRAGLMHDASYIGGAIGALVALYLMVAARRTERTQKQKGREA